MKRKNQPTPLEFINGGVKPKSQENPIEINNVKFHASIKERYAQSYTVRKIMAETRPWMLYDWEK